jgi:hypothetical protein
MTDEDLVAAKLKGYTCLIKFKDGEELLIKAYRTSATANEEIAFFEDAEKFINGCDENVVEYFPIPGLSVTRDSIKYIKAI